MISPSKSAAFAWSIDRSGVTFSFPFLPESSWPACTPMMVTWCPACLSRSYGTLSSESSNCSPRMNATLAMSASSLRQSWGEPSAAQQPGGGGRTLACTRGRRECYRPVAMGTKTIVEGLAGLQSLVGKSLGTTEWKALRYEDIVAFADATGDHQWIHV